jgi:hypothetical protein
MTNCQLCRKTRPLRMSHIVPSFVFDWVKRTAPGAIRLARSPNRRVQDGAKLQLLCDDCEQRFGIWEKEFAENIFAPLHSNPQDSLLEYQDWGLKFAVSVSWRVLTYFETLGVQHLSAAHQTSAQRARRWIAVRAAPVVHSLRRRA